jgi:hypothetical protein
MSIELRNLVVPDDDVAGSLHLFAPEGDAIH